MKQTPLPPLFQRIVADPENELVQQAVASGRKLVGYTCSYVPEPLLAAGGLVPLRLRVPGASGTPLADTYLSSVLCPYVRSLLELALEGGADHLDGWVFAASCDHLRRLYDNLAYLQRPALLYVLDVPHKRGAPAERWYLDELAALADAMQSHFDVDLGRAALCAAIERYNGQLATLRAIAELRLREQPPLTGTAFHQLLVASAMAPRELLDPILRQLHEELSASEGIGDHRARLMVVGSTLDEPGWLGVVESQGGLVVADRFCIGSLPGLEPIEVPGDPLPALASHYLERTRCPRMMADFELRVADIVAAAERYRVHGIVLQTMKFCDLWGVEGSALARALRQQGLAVLRVEREYALSGEGQLRTRVQAFLESLGR